MVTFLWDITQPDSVIFNIRFDGKSEFGKKHAKCLIKIMNTHRHTPYINQLFSNAFVLVRPVPVFSLLRTSIPT